MNTKAGTTALAVGITALAVGVGLFAVACDQSAPSALPDDDAVPAAPMFKLNHSPPVGPVTIVTTVNFSSGSFPFFGTFVVTEGFELLGCTGGDSIDRSGPSAHGKIVSELTCTDGAGAGSTFAVNFNPGPRPGPGDANGHWNVVWGFDYYAGLHGVGDFSVVVTFPVGVGTFTGKIHFEP